MAFTKQPRRPLGLVARIRSLLRGLRNRSEIESDMTEEFQHHIEMRTEDLVRGGMQRSEAMRRAHIEFGHKETYRDRARAARGLRLVDQIGFSWIDVRLGVRMLAKHPVMTIVSTLALAVGIPVGMAPNHLANAINAPLPEDTENRIRAIRFWNPVTTETETPRHFDYAFWSARLTTFSQLGAFNTSSFNVGSRDGQSSMVRGAHVTTSVFEILGQLPVAGRPLQAADESPGAPNVVVIGYDLWRSRFGAESDVVGRSVDIGGVTHTVVGVMPNGFLFPFNEQLWLPLRIRSVGPEQAARLRIFGRLANNFTVDDAQAEVSALGVPAIPLSPDNREQLEPEVVPFALQAIGLPRGGLYALPEFHLFQGLALVLLLVACGNVAMLVFARTATRFRELAIRTALGASRARIVSQIFAETLVLAMVAAAVGVLSVNWLLDRVSLAAVAGDAALPYWFSLDITPSALLWALVLASVSATVAGVLPALRITGRRIFANIQRVEAGKSGIRFGGITGALIVADVAISVTVVGFSIALATHLTRLKTSDELAGIPADEYLAVELRMSASEFASSRIDQDAFTAQLASAQQVLVERLQMEPGVRNVAVADALPRMNHPSRLIQIAGVQPPGVRPGWYVRTAHVDVDFFDALNQPILVGRGFTRSDAEAGSVVIVNTVFVDRLLGGRNPIGERVRFLSNAEPQTDSAWLEIVGVVGHLGTNMVSPTGDEALYVPAAPGTIHPAQLGIHASVTPVALASRVREIAREVNSNIILGVPVVLSDVYQGDWYIMIAVAGGLILLVIVLIALAASGIYAIMSFSIAERVREIGIRSALGASRSTLVMTILRRSLVQIGLGALLGIPVAARALFQVNSGFGQSNPGILAMLGALGLAVGIVCIVSLLSCWVPARRVLGIEATQALRSDA